MEPFKDALGELLNSTSDFAGFSPTYKSDLPACGFDPVCTRAGKNILIQVVVLLLTII